MASEPNSAELRAWSAFLNAQATLLRRLEAELVESEDMTLAEFDVLIQLGMAPDRRLRMTELSDRVRLSHSGVTRLVDRLQSSGFVVMMVLIGGGLVSFWGPLIGALVFILARDLLGAYTETWLLWFGLVFIAMVLFRPEGVAGAWQAWRARCARRAAAGSAGATPPIVREACWRIWS